ncbi:MAG TPA: PilN domain-containing protein, partial [Burkholderiales bacterium]
KRQVADALKEGTPALGPAEHMRAFARQSMGGVWLTGFSLAPAGNGLALRGRALSADLVPAYLGRLNREPVLQGGQFAALEISVPAVGPAAQTVPYVEFRLQAVKPEGSR